MTESKPSPLERYRQLAPNASIRVSPLCLGAMTFGDKEQEKYGKMDKTTAFAVLDHFYDQGGNFIDCANVYQGGQSEEWVGEWMAGRCNRDEIVLTTKFGNSYDAHSEGTIKANTGGNGTKSMKLSLEKSLKRLQTTYIDLFYIHFWDYTTAIPELMHSLNDLVASGKVLYLGVSDTPAWVVAKANQYARDHGLRPFVVYQGMWNAAMRDMERDILPMCQDEGMAICPYGVLNQGRFQTRQGFKEREEKNEGRNFIPTSARDKQVSAHLEGIAKKTGVPLLNVALAYVQQKAPYIFPIIGCRKIEHLQGSIDGLEVHLTAGDLVDVEEGYEFDHGFPHTFLSGTMFDHSKPKHATGPDDVWLTKPLGTFDWVEPSKPIGRVD